MWIKVNKSRATVYSVSSTPFSETTRTCFWIDASSVPGTYGPGDYLKFILNQPLTQEETTAENVIKSEADGDFHHSITQAEADENAKMARNESKHINSKILFQNIWSSCQSQEQRIRLMAAIDHSASFLIAIEVYNYDVARQVMAGAQQNGLIIQQDYDMIDGMLPVYEE